MREDIYFCLDLTEDEHDVINGMLSELCQANGMELAYYREVKTGHIPMIREVKVRFNGKRPIFHRFMNAEGLWEYAKRWEGSRLVNIIPEEE